MKPSEEGYALALATREEFAGLPNVLRDITVSVDLVSDPEGARVTYDGTAYSQQTPLVVRIPLRGYRDLELKKRGYYTVTKTLDFDALKDRPRVYVTMKRRRNAVVSPPPEVRPDRPLNTDPRPDRPTGTGGITTTVKPKSDKPKVRERVAQVELRDGYMRKREKSLRFEQTYDYFGKGRRRIKLPSRYRATVKAYGRYENYKCYLSGVEVVLIVWRRSGWKVEKSIYVDLDDDLIRPMQGLPGGKKKVMGIGRTLRLDQAELEEDVRSALKKAMNAVRDREKARSRR